MVWYLVVVVDWCVSVSDWGWSVVLHNWDWVSVDWSGLVDDGVESVVVIGSVVDSSDRAIRFNQAVLSLDDISVAFLGLALDVSGMRVLDAVVERVFRVGDGLWDDDFVVDGRVGDVGRSMMVGWQRSIDGASGHRGDEEGSDNEALGIRNRN